MCKTTHLHRQATPKNYTSHPNSLQKIQNKYLRHFQTLQNNQIPRHHNHKRSKS